MTGRPSDAATFAEPAAPVLPRELVLASAGSGKTFRISSRIIGLLEAGEDPDRILAATFARKAAGEILNRVLERLSLAALDEGGEARELSRHALLGHDRRPVPAEGWLSLLQRVTRQLHRAGVGTLDGFFVRTAGSFATELGLPPDWRIADEPTRRRLEEEALEDVLASADEAEVVEMVRALMRGDASRGVQDRLLRQARGLRDVLHELDPTVPHPWSPFHGRDEEVPSAGGGLPTDDERETVARRIEQLEPPANKDGSSHTGWKKALRQAAEAVRCCSWDDLICRGVGAKVLNGDEQYYSHPITAPVESIFGEALDLARRALSVEYRAQALAMGRLARDFDEALTRRQKREGAYGFGDITRLLGGGADPLTARPELWYRLDRQARHLLLDEFQDTSVSQWLALRPLAEELLSGHRDERSAVIVADPKQSIYGWRGAEPELVERLGQQFALDPDRLRHSWRSAGPVLELVNRIFEDLPRNPVWTKRPGDRAVVQDWSAYFEPHEPARTDRAGHVRVLVGPRDPDMRAKARPRMMRRAAELVAEIRTGAPGGTVGVLTRHNEAVARLIAELRSLGIEASEEGGTRLTDSPAVVACLALLRLADHPGHTVARYHVARSPLSSVVGLDDHADDEAARRVSTAIRQSIVHDGYGRTLEGWTRTLTEDSKLDRRDLRRMLQLVEAGFRWDESTGGLRPGEFVRFAESERVEDASASSVRVMTVHRAKGLEFDTVVLPEMDTPLFGFGGSVPSVLPERDEGSSRIVRAFPYVPKPHRPLFPDAEKACRQYRARQLRDALGVLYVGLTRARHALHVLVAADDPDGGPSSTPTFARVLREALHAHDEPVTQGQVLYENGDPEWYRTRPALLEGTADSASRRDFPTVEFAERDRTRTFPRRTPSELEGGDRVELSTFLDLDLAREQARAEGTVVHAWCRTIGWLDVDEMPDPVELREAARRAAPGMDSGRIDALIADFHGWLEAGPVRRIFSREAAAPGAALERERPFAIRTGGEILQGVADRLVLDRSGGDGEVRRAHVIDFKTDRFSAADAGTLERAVERYRPQLEAYRRAIAVMHDIDRANVRASLVFLEAGAVRQV